MDINYLNDLRDILETKWPGNRTVNIVCHGHSVPAGYFATPYVDSFSAYPHLLHRIIKERFPFAVLNVIVTGVGGENSVEGAMRFDTEVLNHNPDVITIDYGLNDRRAGLDAARRAWEEMIEKALKRSIKLILLTPSWDQSYFKKDENWRKKGEHAASIRELAAEYNVGLADTYKVFEDYVKCDRDLATLLSHINHPSKTGHRLIAEEIAKYFLAK